MLKPQPTPEAMLATTGIKEILAGSPGRITEAKKDQAEMLPRDFRRALVRWVNDEEDTPRGRVAAPFKYGWFLDKISQVMDTDAGVVKQSLSEKILEEFRPEDHALAAGYLVVVQRVLPYLQSIMPVRIDPTIAKTYNFDPSDGEIAAFRRAYDVANDPEVILRDMARGILISDQVTHFAACYPDLYAATKKMLGFAMADCLARRGQGWRLAWKKERQVACLFQTDTFSPDLLKDLQTNFAKSAQQKGSAPVMSKSGTSKTASMFQPATAATADGDIKSA